MIYMINILILFTTTIYYYYLLQSALITLKIDQASSVL